MPKHSSFDLSRLRLIMEKKFFFLLLEKKHKIGIWTSRGRPERKSFWWFVTKNDDKCRAGLEKEENDQVDEIYSWHRKSESDRGGGWWPKEEDS